eukprot:607399-Rhodomonas_salina.1
MPKTETPILDPKTKPPLSPITFLSPLFHLLPGPSTSCHSVTPLSPTLSCADRLKLPQRPTPLNPSQPVTTHHNASASGPTVHCWQFCRVLHHHKQRARSPAPPVDAIPSGASRGRLKRRCGGRGRGGDEGGGGRRRKREGERRRKSCLLYTSPSPRDRG